MKTAKFNFKNLFFIIAAVLFLGTTSCTKDELESPDSFQEETVDIAPEDQMKDLRKYR